ncbi:hypothetical protein HKD37_16G045027 [Glycine soja]
MPSHVQTGGYECGYYAMHWMWNVVSGDLKNEWSMWFGDGTSLDIEAITTIHKKWATHFLQTGHFAAHGQLENFGSPFDSSIHKNKNQVGELHSCLLI